MTTCFLIVPTDMTRRWLRRYADEGNRGPCNAPKGCGYHNHMVFLDDVIDPARAEGSRCADDAHRLFPATDPRWPRACPCGYQYRAEDAWQVFTRRLWRRADGTGELMTVQGGLDNLPPGAMYLADWTAGGWPSGLQHRTQRTGQPHLHVVCPDGHHWDIDAPARNDPNGWTREGEPPLVTARNSIDTGRYHGYLTAGVFGPDLDIASRR